MGLRFRKSIKIAPGIRINFNAKSTSITFGKKGLHYTVSSTGRKTVSAGIPGTGLSYSASASTKKHRPSQNAAPTKITNPSTKNHGRLVPFLTTIVILSAFAVPATIMCLNSSGPQTSDNSISTEIVTESELETEVLTIMYTTTELNVRTGPGTDNDILATLQAGTNVNVIHLANDWSEIQYNDSTAYVSTKYLTDEYDAYMATKSQQQTDNAESSEPMVWVSYYGSKYHNNSSCSGMKGANQIPLSEAQKRGKSPCKKCY